MPFDLELTLPLLAGLVAGLLIGIERGWNQRDQARGMRVAGIRTFTLIGTMGAVIGMDGYPAPENAGNSARRGRRSGALMRYLTGHSGCCGLQR